MRVDGGEERENDGKIERTEDMVRGRESLGREV